MAYPPPVLATNRTNATPQMDTHAADHNALALAVNDIVKKLDSFTPKGVYCIATKATGASVAGSGTYYEQTLDTLEAVLGPIALTSGRIVPTITGLYLIEVHGAWSSHAGYCTLGLWRNSASDSRMLTNTDASGGWNHWFGHTSAVRLGAGDRVSMSCAQSSGVAKAPTNLRMSVTLIGTD